MVRLFAAVGFVALCSAATAQTPPPQPLPSPADLNARLTAPLPDDQAAMKAHVLFLASDAMRGREAGSAEYDIAANYVAAQFYAAGLRPAGDDGGYLQAVPLIGYKAAGPGDFVWTPPGGLPQPLVFEQDFVPAANPTQIETAVNAGIVFIGYGIDAPDYGHDDFKGIDVRGKIVAVMPGVPARFAGEERAFFASPGIKARAAAAHGAVGIVQIAASPGDLARAVQGYDRVRTTWAMPNGQGKADAPGAPMLGTLSMAAAARLFGAAWSAVAAQVGKPSAAYRRLAPAGSLAVAIRTAFTPGRSSNIIGMIPGSDAKVGREVVVLSAHLDHIGVSAGDSGDRINNGALDNAIGIASLIEEAKRFKASGVASRRTILFLAVTAEEKGLIGSDYFADHPTVPIKDIVADVNLDMPILTYRFEDMVVFGAERSSLGPIVARAVGAIGVTLSPDPAPDEGIFVRSDHFRFVQKGIPSVFLWPGPKGPGKAAFDDFMAHRYHRPGDDLTQPILWDQGVRFVDANYRIAREIADGATRPVWNRGDYFGTLYHGPMAAK